MNTKGYPSDTTDAQWKLIEAAIPIQTGRGRPRIVELRRIIRPFGLDWGAVQQNEERGGGTGQGVAPRGPTVSYAELSAE